jgi:hypothetical protein
MDMTSLRRNNKELTKGTILAKPERKGKKSRPEIKWMDVVEKDMKNFGLGNWKTKTQETYGWRKGSEEAKTYKGL